jgi:hypothetical protein
MSRRCIRSSSKEPTISRNIGHCSSQSTSQQHDQTADGSLLVTDDPFGAGAMLAKHSDFTINISVVQTVFLV